MQATITVREFCEKYLSSTQKIAIVDAENDYIYNCAKVRNIIEDASNTVYNVKLLRVEAYNTKIHPKIINGCIILIV